MPLYSWLLSSLLISQIGGNPSIPVTVAPPTPASRGSALPAATYPGTPSIDVTPNHEPGAPPAQVVQSPAAPAAVERVATASHGTRATPPRATTPQLVADALILPPGSTVSGRPVSLLSVVATAPERPRQIEAVHAYWRLTEALGEYHFAHEHQQRLAQLRAGNSEAANLRTARAIAESQLREAEIQVTSAQHDLAEILLLVPATPLPLPADQPLVGPYRTLFTALFAGKNAPQRARTLNQTLPLRNRAVESHAAALLAAEDTLDAALELQTSGQEHLAGVLSALDAQGRQQRAFLAAVCRYNHDIADYALVVVSPQTTPELLVGTLIKLNRPAGQPVTPLPTTATLPALTYPPRSAVVPSATPLPATATLPATYQQPVVPPALPNRPTRAVRPGEMSAPGGNGPRTVPDNSPNSLGVPPAPPVVAPANSLRNDDPQEPQLAPPQESAIPLLPEKPAGPTTHSSQKPISTSGPPWAPTLAKYAELVGLPPAERTVKLSAVLYSVRNRPSPAGQPARLNAGEKPMLRNQSDKKLELPLTIDSPPQPFPGETPTLRLIDCIRLVPTNRRASAIETYWNTRRFAAEYQSFVEQIQWLETLEPTLSAQNPPSPTAMLVVRAARLTAEAERADVAADFTTAQFELAGLVGLGNEKIVPQPASVPFVGRLPMRVSRSDRSWSQRRLEATIPQREQAIVDQAAAVVEADVSRAAVTADFLAGRSAVERVLAGIKVQARETTAFLRAVTDYNRAIAQYSAATLPTNTEAEKVVAALMVE